MKEARGAEGSATSRTAGERVHGRIVDAPHERWLTRGQAMQAAGAFVAVSISIAILCFDLVCSR